MIKLFKNLTIKARYCHCTPEVIMETSPFDDHVLLLTSPDVTERRKAVIGLGNSGDSRALTIRAIVYEHDPDSALRALAFKTGRHIKGHTGPLTETAKPHKGPDYEPISPFTSIETQADYHTPIAVDTPKIAGAP